MAVDAFYIPRNPAVVQPQGPQAAPAAKAQEAVQSATFASEMEAATAFQKHLDKGYQGMVEVFQTLPPEVQAAAGDPSAFSESQDKQVQWYMTVNDALARGQAVQQAQAGDYAAADATSVTAPMSPESRKATAGFTADRKAEGMAKQVGEFAQSLGASGGKSYGAAELSPKSPFGRSMRITQARLEPLAQDIAAAASQHSVPESLIRAVITRESRGDAKAKNPNSSAKGLMQLIDATAERFGVTDALDPKQSLSGGTQYLKFLLGRYGDAEKAVAAYHEGEGKMDGLLQKLGENWRDGLSEDAKAYVPDVMKIFQAYGGGEIKSAAPEVGSMTKLVADFAKAHPEAVNTPEFKTLADAVKFDISSQRGFSYEEGRNARSSARLAQGDQQFKANKKIRLSEALQKAEIPSIAQSLTDLETLMKPIGGLAAVGAKLPSTEFVERSLNPLFKGETGNEVRSILEAIYSLELKRVSGVAVSDQEYNRYKQRFANDPKLFGGFTAKDQMNALNAYLRAFHKVVDSYRQGYDADVWEEVGGDLGLDKLPTARGIAGTEYTPPGGQSAAAGGGKPKVGDIKKNKDGDDVIFTETGWKPK